MERKECLMYVSQELGNFVVREQNRAARALRSTSDSVARSIFLVVCLGFGILNHFWNCRQTGNMMNVSRSYFPLLEKMVRLVGGYCVQVVVVFGCTCECPKDKYPNR
jgi:hypothetical protein